MPGFQGSTMQPTADESRPTPEQPAEPLPPQIGRYRILERLGAGGMGTVYKAHDPQLDRVVAVKVPRFDGPADKVAVRVQRFQREARVAAQVWHPHVCPTYDVGAHDGQPYVVMAYVEGQSLARQLAAIGRYEDILEAVRVVRQLLDALAAIHARGIIHRDLKPGNIMLDAGGRAILMDFGLARPETDAEHFTSEGAIVGTPAYMAPEQAAGQPEQIGPWTDLYSCGVVLYQMLTGRCPFAAPALTILAKILHEVPPAPSLFRPNLDRFLEMALLKALAKDPAERYQTAEQFAQALQAGSWGTSARLQADSTPLASTSPQQDHSTPLIASVDLPAPGRKYRPVLIRYSPVFALVIITGPLLVAVALSGGYGFLAGVGIAILCFAFFVLFVGIDDLRHGPTNRLRNFLKYAEQGNSDMLVILLETDVDMDRRDELDETALMKAAANGHVASVKILLTRGAEVNVKNRFGQTALSMATAKGHADIVGLLKQAGAQE